MVRVRASYCNGALTTPKSGKVRAVPLAPDVAEALAKLLGQRESGLLKTISSLALTSGPQWTALHFGAVTSGRSLQPAFAGGVSGQTIGKKAMRIRVVSLEDGQPIGYGRALLRDIARFLSEIPIFLHISGCSGAQNARPGTT